MEEYINLPFNLSYKYFLCLLMAPVPNVHVPLLRLYRETLLGIGDRNEAEGSV